MARSGTIRQHASSRVLRPGLLLFGFLCLFLLIGCGRKEKQDLDILRIGLVDTPATLDPHRRNALAEFQLLDQAYERLVASDRNLRLMPGLAESWENPEDNLWRFHLRRGVRFHSGEVLKAADVVSTYRRLMEKPGLEMSSFVSHISSVEEIDPHTVEIRTVRLSLPTLYRILSICIVPANYEQLEDRWNQESFGTGPFRLLSRNQDRIEFERFEEFRGSPPPFRKLIFQFYPNSDAVVNALLDNELDFARISGSAVSPRLKEMYRIASTESLYIVYIAFNLRREDILFSSPEQRKKLDLALNRTELIERATYNFASPATQIVSPFVYGFNPSIKRFNTNHVASSFPEHSEMRFLVRRIFEHTGRELQAQFQRLGIRTKMEVLDDPEFFRRLRAGNFDLYVSRYGCDTVDASELLENIFTTRGYMGKYGMLNYMGYGSAEMDRRIEQSSLMADPAERLKRLQELIGQISQDRPWIPLYINHDVYAVSKKFSWQPRLDSRIFAADFRRAK